MKKKIFTLFALLGVFAFCSAQTLVNFDAVKATSFGGWTTSIGAAANPAKAGLNTTDSCAVANTKPSNWWQVEINFADVVAGTYTGVEFLVYVDAATADISLGELAFSGKSGLVDPAKAKITTAKTWVKMEYELSGIKATDVINHFQTKPNSSDTNAINIYFDEFKLTNYKVPAAEQQDPRLTCNVVKVDKALDIDGLDNELIYDDVDFQNIEVINAGDGAGVTGEFGLLWSDKYFYMFINVEDPELILFSHTGFAAWMGDGVQVYIDPMNRRHLLLVNGITGASVFPKGETAEAIAAGFSYQEDYGIKDKMKTFRTEIVQGSVVTGTGYTIEVGWPWTGIAQSIMDSADVAAWVAANVKTGMKASFDMQLNDARGATPARVNMMSWCSTPKEPYGNSGTWGEITLTEGASSTKDATIPHILVYPNPASEFLTVTGEGLSHISIFDLSGREVISMETKSNITTIKVKDLESGVYMLSATTLQGVSTQKISIK